MVPLDNTGESSVGAVAIQQVRKLLCLAWPVVIMYLVLYELHVATQIAISDTSDDVRAR